MIASAKRLQPTNLAHYWRRIARYKRQKKHKTIMKELFVLFVPLCGRLSFCFFVADEAFAKLARRGASRDAKSFREVTATQVADARTDLGH